ncbi:hypothetical protein C1752_12031 [Acaryochloris thomasi RCC1774]|uniref:Fungal lipase-type domain-containing protein n=1 Tax=Acaryochloris thomasi RCC1774 TaxID=1764569 RepID=A0A2W1J7T3_9CYAN|nr:lipase family protein [Acaryochloris thomasi]PZD70460.1 hypothetical protein C1752_12031 [Acaryochloris thomasi RCC1774]
MNSSNNTLQKLVPPSASVNDVNGILPPDEGFSYFDAYDQYPFLHSAKQFKKVNAWRLADCALLAYAHEDFSKRQFEKFGLQKFRLFSGNSTQCHVASNDQFSIVDFRGTEIKNSNLIQDLLIDVRANFSDSSLGGKVHDGFKAALDEIWYGEDGLLQYLQQLKNEFQEMHFWYTGHSLGAALAVLAAGRFKHVQGIYTYGCPKIGNSAFTSNFAPTNNFYRFVNNNDVIPELPLTNLWVTSGTTNQLGVPIPWVDFHAPELYQQVGSLMYIDQAGKSSEMPSSQAQLIDRFEGIVNNAKDSVVNLMSARLANLPDSFVDHAPVFYAVHTRNNFIDSLGAG